MTTIEASPHTGTRQCLTLLLDKWPVQRWEKNVKYPKISTQWMTSRYKWSRNWFKSFLPVHSHILDLLSDSHSVVSWTKSQAGQPAGCCEAPLSGISTADWVVWEFCRLLNPLLDNQCVFSLTPRPTWPSQSVSLVGLMRTDRKNSVGNPNPCQTFTVAIKSICALHLSDRCRIISFISADGDGWNGLVEGAIRISVDVTKFTVSRGSQLVACGPKVSSE